VRILIIDDDELLCRALRRALAGNEVVAETDARQAIERASRETFDLVLCDLHMPGMSGPQLLARLPANDGTVRLLMSGDCEPGMLHKPFKLRELWAAVEAFRAARCA
jgi:DNA-binding response OmpR family regulator